MRPPAAIQLPERVFRDATTFTMLATAEYGMAAARLTTAVNMGRSRQQAGQGALDGAMRALLWEEMKNAAWALEVVALADFDKLHGGFEQRLHVVDDIVRNGLAQLCGCMHTCDSVDVHPDLMRLLVHSACMITDDEVVDCEPPSHAFIGDGPVCLTNVEFGQAPPRIDLVPLMRAVQHMCGQCMHRPKQLKWLAETVACAVKFAAPTAELLGPEASAAAARAMCTCIAGLEPRTLARSLTEFRSMRTPAMGDATNVFDVVSPMMTSLARLGVAHFALPDRLRVLLSEMPENVRSVLLTTITVSRDVASRCIDDTSNQAIEALVYDRTFLIERRVGRVQDNICNRVSATKEDDERECCVCMEAGEDAHTRMLALDCSATGAREHVVCNECWDTIVRRARPDPPLCPMCRQTARPIGATS
jgi:hypothetical protein